MKINTNDVDNTWEILYYVQNDRVSADEILHFVQNDILFFQNDKEKMAYKKYAPLRELSKTEGDIISKPVIFTHRPADTSLKGRQAIEMP